MKAEKAKDGKKLPRPGTHVEIEFASRERVNAHAELAEDFIRRVLKPGLGLYIRRVQPMGFP